MHEDLAAVVAGEEAIPLVGVVPLDLAGRHAQTSRRRRTNNNQRSGDRQDAMGSYKAIGPGRRTAASFAAGRRRPLRTGKRKPNGPGDPGPFGCRDFLDQKSMSPPPPGMAGAFSFSGF